jgi:hypothetical protein
MSEIRANTVSNAAGTGPATLTGQYAAKAWVNFNGTGTVAIRESGNVSSITDGGAGTYTITFSSALSDANYSAIITMQRPAGDASSGGSATINKGVSLSTTSFALFTWDTAFSTNDAETVCVTVTR